MIIIDAKDLILGRLATRVVKQALMGETIHIVNAEQLVITGDKRNTIAKYKRRRELGAPIIGPFIPRMPDRIVKRAIRGMLDYNSPRGKAAFAKIRCHIGVPAEFAGKEFVSFPDIHVDKTHAQYIYIAEISRELGAKF
jgi:large subunit ribosomal protein L13